MKMFIIPQYLRICLQSVALGRGYKNKAVGIEILIKYILYISHMRLSTTQ